MSSDGRPAAQLVSRRLSIGAIGRASATYALGGFAYKAVALFSVPIIARLLTPAELGVLDLAAVCASIVGLTSGLGTDQSIAFHERRLGRDGNVWGSALAMVAAVAGLLAATAAVLREPLSQLLTGTEQNAAVVAAAGLYGAVIALSALGLTAVRLISTPRTYAVASFLIVSAEMAGALLVAWLVAVPVPWMVLAWSIGAMVVVVPLLIRFMPRWERPRRATVARLLRFGAPLVPAAMAWIVGDVWIRSTLAREAELTTLGEYGIASRIASVLSLAVAGFGVAWHPYLYRSRPIDVLPRAMSTFGPVVLGLGALGAVITVLAPEVIAIVAGPEYIGARDAVPTLTAGASALGAFVLVAGVVGSSGSTRRVAGSALIGTAVAMGAASLLVPSLGLVGAGVASLAGSVTATVVLIGSEPRLLKPRSAAVMGAAVAGTLAFFVAATTAMSASFPFRVLVAAAIVAVAIGMGMLLDRTGRGDPP